MKQILAASESSTRSFFLVFVCFLMIMCGLLIALRSTESTFNGSNDKKVKYSLRTVYPGIVMATLGCLLLAYSVYKSSQLQLIGAHQLITLTNRLDKVTNIASNKNVVYQADLDTNQRLQRPATIKEQKNVESVQDAKSAALTANTAGLTPLADLTAEDIRWANQLAKRAIKFGYYPTKADNDRYNSILKKPAGTVGLTLHTDLQWAFRLLQKTQGGYQPTTKELHRYEDIVGKEEGD